MKMIIAVLLMALVTYIPRAFPLIFVKSSIKSKFFKSFLYYVPFAVLGAMTFPAIIYSTQHTLSAVLGMIFALILAYFGRSLITVVLGSVLIVYICELLI